MHFRGEDADVLFCDECAFFPEQAITVGVLPILSRTHVVAALTSTPNPFDPYNWFDLNFRRHDKHGQPFADVYQHNLRCDECISGDGALVFEPCPHSIFRLPPWKGGERQNQITELMGNNPELQAAEILGYTIADTQSPFRPEALVQVAKDEAFRVKFERLADCELLLVGIDPSGGGTSDFGIVTAVDVNGLFIIIGMEAERCSGANYTVDMCLLMEGHLKAQIARFPRLREIRVFLEANYASATTLVEPLRRLDPRVKLHTNHRHADRPEGVLTTNSTKREGVNRAQRLIRCGALRFATHIICIGKEMNPTQTSTYPRRIISKWIEQGTRFREYRHTTPRDPHKLSIVVHGKGRNKTENDDLFMSMLLVVYFSIEAKMLFDMHNPYGVSEGFYRIHMQLLDSAADTARIADLQQIEESTVRTDGDEDEEARPPIRSAPKRARVAELCLDHHAE